MTTVLPLKVAFLAALLSCCLATAGAATSAEGKAHLSVGSPVPGRKTVNRTVPKVEAPLTGLAFSTRPTTDEIARAWVFEERLWPVGGEPTDEENSALARALIGHVSLRGQDDFSFLEQFLAQHPRTAWRTAVLTCLGTEYYHSARYTLAIAAWEEAWALGRTATDLRGRGLADRALCELAGLYSRLGRTDHLDALLKSIEQRGLVGGAAERINIAREALWLMRNRPEVSFRCGPLALQSIKRTLDPQAPPDAAIVNSASTPRGFSLPEVAEISKKIGMKYRMAFRPADSTEANVAIVVPSVVHWKAGHYAAIVKQVGERFQVHDPTFGTTVWATRRALNAEASGYFLIPPGDLPPGWRSVDSAEGASIRGKGQTGSRDPDRYTPDDASTGNCDPGLGMAVSSVHLMLANLQIRDTPVGYTPPVGPPVRFTVRYNQRDYLQPPSLGTSPFGPRWTHDWNEAILDDPNNPLANVKVLPGGGGAHTFSSPGASGGGASATVAGKLTRPGTNTYERIMPDGSKRVYGLRVGVSPLILLTDVIDPHGNGLHLVWDSVEGIPRLRALVDAIGQVTTCGYDSQFPFRIATIEDPFGRVARFQYTQQILRFFNGSATNFVQLPMLTSITDVLGITSQFTYQLVGVNNLSQPIVTDQIVKLTTPYGQTTFVTAAVTSATNLDGDIRVVESIYPDGSRDRVEYNQAVTGTINTSREASVPAGMATANDFLNFRNTFYWSRTAAASSYGDYSKAKVYHWLHSENLVMSAGILESTKDALESRVWFDYAGQNNATVVGANNRPVHVGRVLDDGSTQLYTYAYNALGNVSQMVDPMGRTLSFHYASNGIDLLEVRQTRGTNNELLVSATYDDRHLPLTVADAARQTNTYTYNARGQELTSINPKGEVTSYVYDDDGYLVSADGPLPGTNDVIKSSYDDFGRLRTVTDVSGYTTTMAYDALDRLKSVSYPDQTSEQFIYDRLDLVEYRDRAARLTTFEYDSLGQIKKSIDPMGRVTYLDWCGCGSLRSLTDPMGRTTTWVNDVQGRLISQRRPDGSEIRYVYEKNSGRLQQLIDEKGQISDYVWNPDDTLKSVSYANAATHTTGVTFTYNSDYRRIESMDAANGTTTYAHHPVTEAPQLGAGKLASIDGPLTNDLITLQYDELGRVTHRAINGVDLVKSYDLAGRVIGLSNALGSFSYAYDGSSFRLASKSLPNGQEENRTYGNTLQDLLLQRMTHRNGITPISEFIYGNDTAASRIATWSQHAGGDPPAAHALGYDSVNQLLSDTVTVNGNVATSYAYSYDAAGNRLTEQASAISQVASYNALNQITATTASGVTQTNEWDALDRLVAINEGNERIEFSYDGASRLEGIRRLQNGTEISHRRFLWCGGEICEERDVSGEVTKRFFFQGVKLESGPVTGTFFYSRDHLGSVREMTDMNGNVRARYGYEPYGRRTRLTGEMEADFGFAGMFWSTEADLAFTQFRAYDPALGRWLSRDPLEHAEITEGPNLYSYVANDPVNRVDPLGLAWDLELLARKQLELAPGHYQQLVKAFERAHPTVVIPPHLRPNGPTPVISPAPKVSTPSPPSSATGGELGLRGRGELDVRGKGELALRPKGDLAVRAERQLAVEAEEATEVAVSRSSHLGPTRMPGPGAVLGGFVDMGMTILTMTDCNTVQGIFALYRQGNGGMANKHADKLYREIKKYL